MGKNRKFSDEFKLSVVKSFVSGASTQYSLCKKYSLSRTSIRNWVRILAPDYKPTTADYNMVKKSESEEIQSLKRALREKELELSREKMRADFYETMVNVAEKQFNIEIRKKAGTKQ